MGQLTPALRTASWAVCLITLSIVLFSKILPVWLGVDTFRIDSEFGLLAWVIASSILGLILIVRAGERVMGWLVLMIGLSGAMASLGAAVPTGPDYMGWLPLVSVSSVGWVTFLGLTLAGLPLLFPTGAPPSRRWRPVLWMLIGLLAFAAFSSAFSSELSVFCSDVIPGQAACSVWESSANALAIGNCGPVVGPIGDGIECQVMVDNPIGAFWVPALEDSIPGDIAGVGLLMTAAAAIVSLGVRMRRAGSQERLQIKAVFLALGAVVAATTVDALLLEVFDITLFGYWIVELLMWLAIPVSIFLAINRFRLYEIDRLISRTVSYAVVVALLLGTVAAVAAVVGTRFSDPLVVAGTTLAVAALFNPLRRRVQSVVDRRFNRSRYDAERVMDQFAGSLRDEVDADEVVEGWVEVVEETMQPSSVGIWMRS